MENQQVNNLIITFTHSNYLEQASGTEKFIRTLSKRLQSDGYNHLVFFSIKTKFLYKTVGVIYNDCFVGVFKYDAIQMVIDSYCYNNRLSVTEVMIQHLRDHDIEILKACIYQLKVPVAFFVHDLYSICPSETMVSSEGRYCEQFRPSEACRFCDYADKAINHYYKMNDFLNSIGKYLVLVICPSTFLKEKWCNAFPDFLRIAIVRPHNILSGFTNYNLSSYPIKIAFCGAQLRNKGFTEWERFCELVRSDARFRLFYLGKGNKEIEGVINIYVNNASQGENAMREAIKLNKIDCAFVWPLCPETYSYVYDELSLNGVFILTNKISGNIAVQVSERGNGVVLDQFEDVMRFIQGDNLITQINEYRGHGTFHPKNCMENNTTDSLILDKQNQFYVMQKPIRIHSDGIMTLAYKIKNSLRKRR